MSKYNKRTRQVARLLVAGLCIILAGLQSNAQQAKRDSTPPPAPPKIVVRDSAYIADSLRRRQIKKATVRSAFIPGWGQATNKQYWKIPLVYAAVGIPAYLFFYNVDMYNQLRDAYIIVSDDDPSNDDQIPDNLKPLSPNSLKFYRDEYRRNVDYSVLAFIIAWGLNVADAAVYANLRDFDVSDKISMQVKPNFNPVTGTAQVGLVFRSNTPGRKVPKYNYSR